MKNAFLLLLPALALSNAGRAADNQSISARQVITTCVQKGSAPCAVGVDNRTINVNNKIYRINKETINELDEYFRQNMARLSADERSRFELLRNDLRRVESKIDEVGEDIKKLRDEGAENAQLLRDLSSNRKQVVPDVIGMNVDRAKASLYEKNILPKVVAVPNDSEIPVVPGTVVSQTPSPGTEADLKDVRVQLRKV